MNKRLYVILGAVLIVLALALVFLLGDKSPSNEGGVAVPQPSGDDAALKNLRVN